MQLRSQAIAGKFYPQKRDKVFGPGRRIPLGRNAKKRIMAKVLSYRHHDADGTAKAKGKAYGALSAKMIDVARSLIYDFHNCDSGACFPSYDAIIEKVRCARQTVRDAILKLEALGLLDFQNRIHRVQVVEPGPDMFGKPSRRVRVLRTSNAYAFNDPNPNAGNDEVTKSSFPTGTPNQDFFPLVATSPAAQAALDRAETSRQWLAEYRNRSAATSGTS